MKISGDLLKNQKALMRLKKFSKNYSTVVIVGGGTDINDAFSKEGYESRFCPLGRITDTLEERQLARNVLERNQALVQDLLDEQGINARAVIPFREVGTVLYPENGDVMILSSYIGFDKILIFTKRSRVKEKRAWLKQVAEVFQHIEKGELDKIEVIGF